MCQMVHFCKHFGTDLAEITWRCFVHYGASRLKYHGHILRILVIIQPNNACVTEGKYLRCRKRQIGCKGFRSSQQSPLIGEQP